MVPHCLLTARIPECRAVEFYRILDVVARGESTILGANPGNSPGHWTPDFGIRLSMTTLSIIEPNLRNPSGHYAEFVHALSRPASEQLNVELLVSAHPQADELMNAMPAVRAVTESPRVTAPLGEWRILLKNIRSSQRTLVLTAKAKHVWRAELFSRLSMVEPRRLSFYFHWIEHSSRMKLLHRASRSIREHSQAIATTEGIAASLRELGWRNVAMIPYPATPPSSPPRARTFEKLLVAGAARINKGLPLIADLAEHWAKTSRQTPLWVQISTKHAGRHGQKEQAVVNRLLASGYQGLQCERTAPPTDAYFKRFQGALVLAPYDRAKFASGVSGVVLDGLLRGCPAIATKGTWAGDQIERFGAGLTLENQDSQTLESSIDHILQNWDAFTGKALAASKVLADEHSPHELLRAMIAFGRQATANRPRDASPQLETSTLRQT